MEWKGATVYQNEEFLSPNQDHHIYLSSASESHTQSFASFSFPSPYFSHFCFTCFLLLHLKPLTVQLSPRTVAAWSQSSETRSPVWSQSSETRSLSYPWKIWGVLKLPWWGTLGLWAPWTTPVRRMKLKTSMTLHKRPREGLYASRGVKQEMEPRTRMPWGSSSLCHAHEGLGIRVSHIILYCADTLYIIL